MPEGDLVAFASVGMVSEVLCGMKACSQTAVADVAERRDLYCGRDDEIDSGFVAAAGAYRGDKLHGIDGLSKKCFEIRIQMQDPLVQYFRSVAIWDNECLDNFGTVLEINGIQRNLQGLTTLPR